MYKLKTSARGSEDLSIAFSRDWKGRRDELSRNKNMKGKYHLRIMVKHVFGFREGQEKAT